LQDAYNLAWKLAMVVQGRADASLLDTYEQERIPVAHRLLETTDQAFQAVVSEGWLPTLLRTKVIARVAATAMRFALVRRFAFRTISQIGISYPQSALSQALPGLSKHAPAAGERFPWLNVRIGSDDAARDLYRELDDTRFNLLVIGQAAPSSMMRDNDLLRVHFLPLGANEAEFARVGIRGASFYLLRPDGHVGLCGAGFDGAAITKYLADRVHLKTHAVRTQAA
jgi:hypothetical protein